eukprot:149412_1
MVIFLLSVTQFKMYQICTHCINKLLSTVHLLDLLHFYLMPHTHPHGMIKHNKYAYLFELATLWFNELCIIPAFYKIVGKFIKINATTFNKGEQIMKMNDYIEKQIYEEPYENHPHIPFAHSFDFICAIAMSDYSMINCLRMLFLSTKYWNGYQTVFFINHYVGLLVRTYVLNSDAEARDDELKLLPTTMIMILLQKYCNCQKNT